MIREALRTDLEHISQLHITELPNTMNSRIGKWLINDLYTVLLLNREMANVWVYEENNTLLGLIATTSNRNLITHKIFSSLTFAKWNKIFLFILIHPFLVFGNFIFSRHLNKLPAQNSEYILTIAVNSKYQRKNVGSLLLQHIEQEAKKVKKDEIQVDTSHQNVRACNFYNKNNYQEIKKVLGNSVFRKKI